MNNDNQKVSFNYLRFCLLFLLPFIMYFLVFFVSLSIFSDKRWWNSILPDVLVIITLIGIIIYFIIVIGGQKKLFLKAVEQYLGSKNKSVYKKIEKSLYVGYKFRLSVRESSLEGLDINNPFISVAIHQTKKFVFIFNLSIIGSMFLAGAIISSLIDIF